ncbi:response regulator transcription factor [Nocardioides sp.]|uniref:helix-turn-helix transcriptional regulator n=1 Tax=Nocardioides sp. TaxID=35761 RepID=UPI002B277F69|nr:response regulator transcription factor [Nocardioides sp.]
MTRSTRVLITSEHDVVRTGLTTLLDEHDALEVSEGAVDSLVLDGADVVLYDVMALVESDESELVRMVKETDVAVLAVTRDLRPDLADTALATGVDGCVSLDASAEELVAAVEAAAWGDLSGAGDPGATDFTVNPGLDDDRVHLAPREEEVLSLITAGLSNVEIAERLYLSINSVKTYIRGAYRRIDVRTRSQAVVWCMQNGLAAPPTD